MGSFGFPITGVKEMVSGAINSNNFPITDYAMKASSGGKISLPVQTNFLIYSHFKNISGTPAPEGSSGISISSLNILDVLIEQINKLPKKPAPVEDEIISQPGKLEALLEVYKNSITEIKAASESMPYISVPPSPLGAIMELKV